MKPLAAYVRISRIGDRDRDEMRSEADQREAIARYAKGEGIELRWGYEAEVDVSGSRARRPILDGIRGQVKAGELGGIVVAKLDRLSRMSPKDRILLFEDIEQSGGRILSASEQLDPSTPEGRFARDVFLGVARMQWEKYRDGFETAKAGAIARGIPVHTRAAVGLRQCEGRQLGQDPAIAPVVREVFELRAQGEGPTRLGRHLEDAGVSTSQGSATWSKQAVYNLLSNPVYHGKLRYGRDDRYVFQLADPIVDLATWTAAQHPNGRRLSPPRSESSEFLLTGTLRCWACRYCLQATTTSRGKRIYRCTRTHSGGVCPAPARVDAEKVETVAIDAFWTVTGDLEAVGAQDDHGDVSALETALEGAQRRVDQLEGEEAQDAFGDRWFSVVRQRRDERDRAAEELGKARAISTASSTVSVETLRGAWPRMTTQDRREVVGLAFDCIALRRDPLVAVVYPAGLGPDDLPRRGFKRVPILRSFSDDLPDGARVLTL